MPEALFPFYAMQGKEHFSKLRDWKLIFQAMNKNNT